MVSIRIQMTISRDQTSTLVSRRVQNTINLRTVAPGSMTSQERVSREYTASMPKKFALMLTALVRYSFL